MDDVDTFAGDKLLHLPCIAGDTQRVGSIGSHRQPFAAKGAQFADQRAIFAGDDGAGARLQQRQRDIDGGLTLWIVAQRRHELQNGGAGKRTRFGTSSNHHRRPPLAEWRALRREGDIEMLPDLDMAEPPPMVPNWFPR